MKKQKLDMKKQKLAFCINTDPSCEKLTKPDFRVAVALARLAQDCGITVIFTGRSPVRYYTIRWSSSALAVRRIDKDRWMSYLIIYKICHMIRHITGPKGRPQKISDIKAVAQRFTN